MVVPVAFVVCAQAISKLAFDFERCKLAIEEVRELIYREILEYHPQVSSGPAVLLACPDGVESPTSCVPAAAVGLVFS